MLETLLFLPGASGDTGLWRPLGARLTHRGPRRFFAWPGFGGAAPDPSVRGLADLGRRVAQELSGPVELFAHSMGGVVAALAALEKPNLVRHLVLSATSGGVDVAALGGVDWRPDFRRSNPQVPPWFEQERWELSERLPELRMPVLLLWGDADPISPVVVGERLARLLPDAELVVIAGAGHDLAAARADEILPHVERHLAKASAGAEAP